MALFPWILYPNLSLHTGSIECGDRRFSRLPRMSDNNGNNKRKRPPEDLEDLDRDPPDGPEGIAFFFYHCERRVSHNEEGKSEEPTCSILILLIIFNQCRKMSTCLITPLTSQTRRQRKTIHLTYNGYRKDSSKICSCRIGSIDTQLNSVQDILVMKPN